MFKIRETIPRDIADLKEAANQFAIATLTPTPKDEPKLRARTWSSVFGDGGAVCLELEVDGKRVDLKSVSVEDNDEAQGIRDELSYVIDEWNNDDLIPPREHWAALVEDARAKVLAFSKKQVVKYTEEVAKYEAGDWS